MLHCINTNHPEFKELQKKSTYNPHILRVKVALWQYKNNETRFPTINELENMVTESDIKSISTADKYKKPSFKKVPSDLFNQMRKNDKLSDDLTMYKNREGEWELMTDTHNPFVWGIENREGLVQDWEKNDKGKWVKKKIGFYPKKATQKVKDLYSKYSPEAKFSTFKFEPTNIRNKKTTRIQTTVPYNPNNLLKQGQSTEYEQRAGDSKPLQPRVKESNKYREEFNRQKEIMLNVFPEVRQVIEDINIPQLGLLEAGGSVIRVNPNLMTRDTLGHEFGHLLVDLIGGLNNTLVQQGLKQLEGSKIEKRVLERYPDLAEDITNHKLKKEILAQAIGEEVAKIFNEREIAEKGPKWQRWLMRFFRRVKQVLKIEKSTVRRLANMVVGEQYIERTNRPSREAYEQRDKKKNPEEDDPEQAEKQTVIGKVPKYIEETFTISSEENELRLKAIDSIQNKIKIYKRRDNQEKIAELRERLEVLESEESDLDVLLDFSALAVSQINSVYNRFKKAREAYKKGDKEAIDSKHLIQWADYVNGFRIVKAIRKTIVDRHSDVDDEQLKKILKQLSNTSDQIDEIDQFILEDGRNVIVDKFAQKSTRIKSEYRLIFEREWRNLSDKEKADISMNTYISNRMKEFEGTIEDRTTAIFKAELEKGAFDISYIARWADTVLNSDDMVISTLVKSYALQLENSRLEGLKYRDKLVGLLRDLENYQNKKANQSEESFYSFMLERDEDGKLTGHYIDKFRSSFKTEYERVKRMVNELEGMNETAKENVLYKYRKMNIITHHKDLNQAKYDYMKELMDGGILTYEEFERVVENDKSRYAEKDLSKVLKGNEHQAAGYIQKWISQNIWNFRDPVKEGRKVKEIKNSGQIIWEKSITNWHNPQWDELQSLRKRGLVDGVQTDPRIKFYDFIVETNNEIDQVLPYQHRLGTRLPGIAKSFIERLQSRQGLYKSTKEITSEWVSLKPYDVEKGEMAGGEIMELVDESNNPKLFLPVFYSNEIPVDDQSFDIASIYYNRYKMGVTYKNTNEVLSDLELTKFLIDNRDIVKLDNHANPIKNANKALINRELTKSGASSLIAAQLGDWVESVVYGKMAKDEGTWTVFGSSIDKAKAADALNRFTALNMLGINFVQGTANTMLGETMQIAESFAGEFYTMKNYRKASREYAKNLVGILGDIGSRKPENKVNLLAERFDVLNDYGSDDAMRKSSKFSRMMMTNTLFFTSHAGEHMMQTRAMMAMLDYIKARDSEGNIIKDKDGKELSLLDAYSVNDKGELVLDKRVELTEEEVNIIGLRMKRILSRMHGEYSQLGKIALQRLALGRMGYMFRKFVIPGMNRRWEVSKRKNRDGSRAFKYNEIGEFFTEGSYITTGRVAGKTAGILLNNFLGRLFKDANAFKHESAKAYLKGLTTLERANIKRTVTETIALVLAFILGNLFVKLAGDEDDETKQAFYSHAAYQFLRLRSELFFFSNPIEAMRILKSPAAAMSIIENTIRMVELAFNPLDDDRPWTRFKTGPWKDHMKMEKYFINMVPVAKQVPRLLNIENQMHWFKN